MRRALRLLLALVIAASSLGLECRQAVAAVAQGPTGERVSPGWIVAAPKLRPILQSQPRLSPELAALEAALGQAAQQAALDPAALDFVRNLPAEHRDDPRSFFALPEAEQVALLTQALQARTAARVEGALADAAIAAQSWRERADQEELRTLTQAVRAAWGEGNFGDFREAAGRLKKALPHTVAQTMAERPDAAQPSLERLPIAVLQDGARDAAPEAEARAVARAADEILRRHDAPRSEFRPRTIAAMILGGVVLSAGYPYMVLKIGQALPMSMVAALLAHLVIAGLFRRKDFSARENNLVQTAANSAAATGFMVVVLAALDMLGFTLPPLMVFLWLTISSSLGILMSVPVRRQFIEIEKLPFPDGLATGQILRALDDPKGSGRRRTGALAVSGIVSFVVTWLRDGFSLIPGVLFGNGFSMGLEPSLMLFGSGIIMGVRTVAWMLAASLLTWGVLAPMLMAHGLGAETARLFHLQSSLASGDYFHVLMRWTMWPATILMVSHGVTSLIAHWRSVVESFHAFARAAKDPAGAHELSFKSLLTGIVGLTIALALVQFLWLGVSPLLTLLGVAVSFVLMLVGIRALGETNWGPISILGNLTQLLFGAVSPGNMAANMATSGSTGAIANSSQDLMLDLKAAHLVGNRPKSMTLAQLIGVPIGALMLTIVYPMLKSVYGFGEHGLPAPTAYKWKAFAELLNHGWSFLPPGTIAAMIVAGVAGVALALIEKRRPKARWVPSAMGIGFAMILPAQSIIVMGLGGLFGWWISKRKTSKSPLWLIPTGAGLIAGEAFAIFVISVLKTLGVL